VIDDRFVAYGDAETVTTAVGGDIDLFKIDKILFGHLADMGDNTPVQKHRSAGLS